MVSLHTSHLIEFSLWLPAGGMLRKPHCETELVLCSKTCSGCVTSHIHW